MEIQTPFAPPIASVLPQWIDHNGHMNVGYYHVAFDQASDSLFDWFGFTPEFRQKNAASTFALETHLTFVRELKQGDPLRFEARLVDFDYKRLHFYQEMFHATEGYLAATYESLSTHMDMRQRKTAAMPDALLERLALIKQAHARLPRPWQLGHVISARPVRG
ncbi:MAG: thioesterase family protein [Quisquiliibacterium sp.]|jgi:acyl-CoA thioester hydrolase